MKDNNSDFRERMKAYTGKLKKRERRLAKNKYKRNKGLGRESTQFKSGELNPRAKLTNDQVLHIYNGQDRPCDLIRMYEGLTYSMVNSIREGRSWAWLTGHEEKQD